MSVVTSAKNALMDEWNHPMKAATRPNKIQVSLLLLLSVVGWYWFHELKILNDDTFDIATGVFFPYDLIVYTIVDVATIAYITFHYCKVIHLQIKTFSLYKYALRISKLETVTTSEINDQFSHHMFLGFSERKLFDNVDIYTLFFLGAADMFSGVYTLLLIVYSVIVVLSWRISATPRTVEDLKELSAAKMACLERISDDIIDRETKERVAATYKSVDLMILTAEK